MKKMLLSLFAAGVLAVIGAGCSSMETNRVGNQVQVLMPVYAIPQVDVANNMVNGSATIHSILGLFSWGVDSQAVGINYGTGRTASDSGFISDLLYTFSSSERIACNAAAYNAVTENKADILLAPQYVTTVTNYIVYKRINSKVKGFPGKLKGIKVVDTPAANLNATIVQK